MPAHTPSTYLFRADGSVVVGSGPEDEQPRRGAHRVTSTPQLYYEAPQLPSRISRRGLPCPDDRTGDHPWIRVSRKVYRPKYARE